MSNLLLAAQTFVVASAMCVIALEYSIYTFPEKSKSIGRIMLGCVLCAVWQFVPSLLIDTHAAPDPPRHYSATRRDISREVKKYQIETVKILTSADSIPYIKPKVVKGWLWVRVDIKGKSGMHLAYVELNDENGGTIRRETGVDVPLNGFHVFKVPIPQGRDIFRASAHMAPMNKAVYSEKISCREINGKWEHAWQLRHNGKLIDKGISSAFPLAADGEPDW